jgi:hypothetical protein
LTPSTSGRSPERYSILRIGSNRILGCNSPWLANVRSAYAEKNSCKIQSQRYNSRQ